MHLIWSVSYAFSCTSVGHQGSDPLYPEPEIEIRYQVDWQKGLYWKRIQEFRDAPVGYNKVVFLGNSITEGGGDWNQRFGAKNIVNRGISGDHTEGVIARLGEIIHFKPKAVFLLIGINDIFNSDHPERDKITPGYVAGNILRIAEQLRENSPGTEVFIQTVLPVNEQIFVREKGWFPEHTVPLDTQIRQINGILKDQDTYQVIDLHAAFTNDESTMNERFTTDGVHLNDAGYRHWVQILIDPIGPFAFPSAGLR